VSAAEFQRREAKLRQGRDWTQGKGIFGTGGAPSAKRREDGSKLLRGTTRRTCDDAEASQTPRAD
jgi:hypothetical protein